MPNEDLQAKIASIQNLWGKPPEVLRALKDADFELLHALILQTGSTGQKHNEYAAMGAAAAAVLQGRLAENLVFTMKKLNSSATILSYVGIAVALVIGAAEIIVPLLPRR